MLLLLEKSQLSPVAQGVSGAPSPSVLGKDGAPVVVNYVRNADKSREVVSAIEAAAGRALAVRADMSQIGDVRRLFQETVDRFGRLDILVNNAGWFQPHTIAEVVEDEFDAAFALNAKGAFFAFQEAARRMGTPRM